MADCQRLLEELQQYLQAVQETVGNWALVVAFDFWKGRQARKEGLVITGSSITPHFDARLLKEEFGDDFKLDCLPTSKR